MDGSRRTFGLFITKDDRIYLADGRAHKINIPDRNGKLLHSFGSQGTDPGQFNLPHALCVSPTYELYVVEIRGQRIQKFVSLGE